MRTIELTKQEFKKLYFDVVRITRPLGWDASYWEQFYENESGKQYFFTLPTSPEHNRLCITQDRNTRRLYLLSTDQEEGFYGH